MLILGGTDYRCVAFHGPVGPVVITLPVWAAQARTRYLLASGTPSPTLPSPTRAPPGTAASTTPRQVPHSVDHPASGRQSSATVPMRTAGWRPGQPVCAHGRSRRCQWEQRNRACAVSGGAERNRPCANGCIFRSSRTLFNNTFAWPPCNSVRTLVVGGVLTCWRWHKRGHDGHRTRRSAHESARAACSNWTDDLAFANRCTVEACATGQ